MKFLKKHGICLFLILQSCSNISINSISFVDKEGEGYYARNRRGTITVRSFSLNEKKRVDSLAFYKDQFELKIINGDQLRQMLRQDQFTWVTMWATWSEPSLEQLPTYQQKAERFGLQLVLICTDLETNTIARHLKNANFRGIAYVLDPGSYYGLEMNRIMAFREDIYPHSPLTGFEMPHHYIFDGNKLVYFTNGFLRSDSIQVHLR
jgi:thiol-disulfide isomerase/thioredoxin